MSSTTITTMQHKSDMLLKSSQYQLQQQRSQMMSEWAEIMITFIVLILLSRIIAEQLIR